MGDRRRLASAMAGLSVAVALASCTAAPAADPAADPGVARDADGSRPSTRPEAPDRVTAAARPDARPRSADGSGPTPPDRGADETVVHEAALERVTRDCRGALASLDGMLRLPEPSAVDVRRAGQRLSPCTASLTAAQAELRRAGSAEEPDVRRAVAEVRRVLGTATRLAEELTRIADTPPQLAALVRELDRGIEALPSRPGAR